MVSLQLVSIPITLSNSDSDSHFHSVEFWCGDVGDSQPGGKPHEGEQFMFVIVILKLLLLIVVSCCYIWSLLTVVASCQLCLSFPDVISSCCCCCLPLYPPQLHRRTSQAVKC